jgi:hypothetical protein
VKANLTDVAGLYITNLCKTSGKVNPNSALRFPLQLALLISPLCLLLPLNLEKRSFNRGALMQWSIQLGALKPEILQEIEKRIWKAILNIVNQPCDYLAILKDLASTFPSTAIDELEKLPQTVTAWFNIDLQHTSDRSNTFLNSQTQHNASSSQQAESSCPPYPTPLCDPVIDVTQTQTSSLAAPSLAQMNRVTYSINSQENNEEELGNGDEVRDAGVNGDGERGENADNVMGGAEGRKDQGNGADGNSDRMDIDDNNAGEENHAGEKKTGDGVEVNQDNGGGGGEDQEKSQGGNAGENPGKKPGSGEETNEDVVGGAEGTDQGNIADVTSDRMDIDRNDAGEGNHTGEKKTGDGGEFDQDDGENNEVGGSGGEGKGDGDGENGEGSDDEDERDDVGVRGKYGVLLRSSRTRNSQPIQSLKNAYAPSVKVRRKKPLASPVKAPPSSQPRSSQIELYTRPNVFYCETRTNIGESMKVLKVCITPWYPFSIHSA